METAVGLILKGPIQSGKKSGFPLKNIVPYSHSKTMHLKDMF